MVEINKEDFQRFDYDDSRMEAGTLNLMHERSAQMAASFYAKQDALIRKVCAKFLDIPESKVTEELIKQNLRADITQNYVTTFYINDTAVLKVWPITFDTDTKHDFRHTVTVNQEYRILI